MAAPQQEAQKPVAWYEYNADLDAWFLAYRRNPKAKTRPLVFGDTTPQSAPTPLSDAQIKELIEDGVFLGNCKEIVRAIEHANGITQKGGSNAE